MIPVTLWSADFDDAHEFLDCARDELAECLDRVCEDLDVSHRSEALP